MDESVASAPKKTTRSRKTATAEVAAEDIQSSNMISTPIKSGSAAQTGVTADFDELVAKLVKTKIEFDNLQKEIAQIKLDWVREQKQHDLDVLQRNTQEELERKREEETYEYETSLIRKRAEDEFTDKKLAWEKDLAQRKDELEAQRKELEQLRKQVVDFEGQKDQAIKETQVQIEKELTDQFDAERKLKDQEVNSEKEILGLKISNLEADNSRLNKEIEILKRSLDEATRQVKEIAVKVIESGSQTKNQTTSES